MIRDDFWFNCSDGTKLFVRRWIPSGTPSAVVTIAHGMAEHTERYGCMAEKFNEAGIEIWAADQRGHGKTADLSVNNPGKGGLLGFCGDKNGFDRVTSDVSELNSEIKKLKPGIPLFLFGHSWGSFISQNYIESKETEAIDGCILSGSRGPDGIKLKAGSPVMNLLATLNGKRRKVPFARTMADGPYNKPFRPNRTPFDWLSRDEAEVDKYINDPFCGFLCSVGFYSDMIKGLLKIHREENMALINKDLPVYIFGGSDDPVGDMGASTTALVNAYRSLGIQDLEFVLYPGARHETLNETNREEVIENLIQWIKRHIKQKD